MTDNQWVLIITNKFGARSRMVYSNKELAEYQYGKMKDRVHEITITEEPYRAPLTDVQVEEMEKELAKLKKLGRMFLDVYEKKYSPTPGAIELAIEDLRELVGPKVVKTDVSAF